MSGLDRREFIHAFASAVALWSVITSRAIASTPFELSRWAQDVADLNRDLSAGRTTLLEWQGRIAALNTGVTLADLKKYLDFDRLTEAMEFPSSLAETRDPKFPAEINIKGMERPWFLRFFGMRKGGAINTSPARAQAISRLASLEPRASPRIK